MSSIMEPDKENQAQQTLSRKVVLESSAPRTPFAEVNRQRSFGADLVGIAFKSGQPPSKSRSWAPDSHFQRQSCATSNPHVTPLRNKAKETSLLKQVLKKDGELGGHEDQEISAQAMDSTEALCVSPVMTLLESGSTQQLAPVLSLSCPEVLSSDVLLPPISEASPDKLAVGLSLSPGQLPALSPEREAPDTPDLSMGCEEGTPLAPHDLSCKTESDVDVSYDCVDTGRDSSMSETPGVSSCSLSDEGISSEVNTPERKAVAVISGSQGGIAQSSDTQAAAAAVNDNHKESAQAARFIVDVLLNAVEEQVTLKPQNLGGTDPVACEQTFLSEYGRFVESYNQEESPAFGNRSSSLTDVTPCSQESEVQTSASCSALSDSWRVVADSLRSFLSDSDESLSSSSTVHMIQRHLAFEDRDMYSPEANLDESFGRVRSSKSMFDLREPEGDSTPEEQGTEERGDSAERDFLNLSVSDQRVEFIPLPPKLKLVGSSPIDLQNQSRSCSSVSTETISVPVSPVIVCHRSTITDVQTTPRVRDTCSIALSPMPASVCDQEANTSLTQTADVDTMTQTLLTTEVALSPMVVARREVDTMTMVTSTTEAGMETERAEFLDHSVLATTDMDSKMTMTDHTGHRNVFTTMTPFKAMAKEGRRLTADVVRKQHPRALANQLETLTVANSRLEGQARSTQQEHKRLQGALKEAKQLAASRQAELEAVESDTGKQEEAQEKEKHLKERCQFLEQLSEEQQSRVATLEQELPALRQESQGGAQRQAEELRKLQEKCRMLEEKHAGCVQQHQREMEELKKSQEGDSYRQQFERAQQMVREREAELEEVRGLFGDLRTTAGKQEKVHAAYQMMHDKIVALASQNHMLEDSIASRTWMSQVEVEGQQAEMRMLQGDNARLLEELTTVHHTMTIHTTNLAELEKLYSVSSYDLLAATGRVVELNSDLFTSRKALQEMMLSREEVIQQAQEMEEQLADLTDTVAVLRAALKHTQDQITQQAVAYEKLQTLSHRMKKVYEDKLENMALGVGNLQRTLDNRETDMNNLEKDLYECRNIIVEQRYKIDGLESQLRDTHIMAAAKRAEDEDIEFYKKSNAFLDAERSVYVQSLRDLEDQLKAMAVESCRQQQVATDTEQLLEEQQEEQIRLIAELSQMQKRYVKNSKALAQATEEQERVESDVTASANDLLQHMRLMLTQLKKKTGLQEVPEAYPTEAQQPLPPSPSACHSSKHVVKSRRHARKSFVSSILGAAEPERGAAGSATEPDSDWESGSYLGRSMTDSVRKSVQAKHRASSGSLVKREVKEVSVTSLDMPQLGAYGSSDGGDARAAASSSSGRRKLDFSNPLSVSWAETSSSPGGTGASFRPTRVSSSSSLPGCSLRQPPSSEPRPSTSGGMAKVRSLPRTEYRPQPGGQEGEEEEGKGGAMMGCVTSLKEVFASITRLFGILDRATQLSLQDFREENAMLRERTEKLEEREERNRAEMSVSRQESTAKDSTILKLQQLCQERTEQMINLTDQKFQIRRLNEETKRLESQLLHERKGKEVVSAELDGIIRRMETSSTDGGAAEARCMRDIVALKKKNLQLLFQLEEQRNHYEDLGSKAARRMQVLDENWKKAEDELYRLDELVENIKQIAERSSSPSSDLHHVFRLIQGETKSSPM